MGLLGEDVDVASVTLWDYGEDLYKESSFKDARVAKLGQIAVEALSLRDVGVGVLQVGLGRSGVLFCLVVGKLSVGDDTYILLRNVDVVAGAVLGPDLHDESFVFHLTS